MTSTLLVSTVLRATVLFGLAFGVAALLVRRSAAERRLVFLLALSSSIGLLALTLGLPGRPMAHLVPAEGAARIVAEALSSAPPAAGPSPAPGTNGDLAGASSGALPLLALWLFGVSLALVRLGHGVLRARGLIRRAEPVRPGVALSREIEGAAGGRLLSAVGAVAAGGPRLERGAAPASARARVFSRAAT